MHRKEQSPLIRRGGKSSKTQPFSEHIRELRWRSLYSIAALFIASVAGFFIHKQLFSIVRRPLNEQLYFTTPAGGFNAIIKISIVFGFVVAVPVFIYHVGKFLSPAFKQRIRAPWIILFSVSLAAVGVLFAYFISLPSALRFLANIDTNNFESLITVNEYLNFVAAYLAGFAILFQLPLIMLFINRIKPQRPGKLMRGQRWVILLSFIAAAILTPTPDPVNQALMAGPIILLYQFSIVLIWFINRKKAIQLDTAVEPQAPDKTEIKPAQIAIPALVKQQVKKKNRSRLIMDVFWIPHNPAA